MEGACTKPQGNMDDNSSHFQVFSLNMDKTVGISCLQIKNKTHVLPNKISGTNHSLIIPSVAHPNTIIHEAPIHTVY